MDEANFKSLVEHMPLEYFDLQDVDVDKREDEDPITKMFTDPNTRYFGNVPEQFLTPKEEEEDVNWTFPHDAIKVKVDWVKPDPNVIYHDGLILHTDPRPEIESETLNKMLKSMKKD